MPVTAICSEIGAKAPEWVQVLPSGPDIKGLDGRSWLMRNPQVVIHAFKNAKIPMVIDYEHGQVLKAPNGDMAPAAGWIEDLEIRDGQIWAKVDWTRKAAEAINNREYRFLSPAFSYDNETKEILGLSSVGLTNNPNLVMQALNSKSAHVESERDWSAVSKALGTNINSQDDLLNALNSRNASEELSKAEQVVDKYISEAVFVPSQRDFLIATCRTQGIDKFEAFASVNTGFSHLARETTFKPLERTSKLSATQLAVCRNVGVTEQQFLNIQKKEG
ncbi:phage protease [Vibrio sp. M260112]|uniref:phage protease n=1 Tax=Vibrio sp. M260112 TaxID=3020895 RepID=UPI002F40D331